MHTMKFSQLVSVLEKELSAAYKRGGGENTPT